MAGEQRIKGQEVEVLLVADGEVQTQLTAIQSFEVTLQFESKEEGFLGEKTNRFDDVFNGISGGMDLQHGDPAIFSFFELVKNRAQRQSPGTVVNIKATLNYPSGERRRVIIPNVFFDPMGLNFAGRTEYGSTRLDFKASDYRTL